MAHEIPEIPVKEIGELLDTVSVKVPALVGGLVKSFYSAEAGKSMGQAVGSLYQELIAAGIPQPEALQMAKDYMLSLKSVAQSIQHIPHTEKKAQTAEDE